MDASGGHAWRLDAECLGEPTNLFFRVRVRDDKAEDPDPDARAICDRCPVRPECLNFAIATNQDYGTWGGTSGWQRRQLKRRYRRMMCPVCRDVGGILVEMGNAQACLACAVSWRATPARSAR